VTTGRSQTGKVTSLPLEPQLLSLLACPEDKGPLLYFADEEVLYNPRLRRRYRVVDGIPVMLVDQAEAVTDAEHQRLEVKAAGQGTEANSQTAAGTDSVAES